MAEIQEAEDNQTTGYNIFRPAPLVSIILTLWVFLLHISPDIYHTFPTPLNLFQWRLAVTVALVLMLVMEAKRANQETETDQEAPGSQSRTKGKRIVEYPPKITGVIYADTYMPLGDNADIKIRTMLARACPLCDKEKECWESAGAHISKNDFHSNMECKEGLRELGVRA